MASDKKIYLSKNQKVFGPLSAEDLESLRIKDQLGNFDWIWRDPAQGWRMVNQPPAPPVLDATHSEIPDLSLAPAVHEPSVHTTHSRAHDQVPNRDLDQAESPSRSQQQPPPLQTTGRLVKPLQSTQLKRDLSGSLDHFDPGSLSHLEHSKSGKTSSRLHPSRELDPETVVAVGHNHKVVISAVLTEINREGFTLSHVSPSSQSRPCLHSNDLIFLNLLNPHSGKSQNIEARVSGAFKNQGFWEYRVHWKNSPELVKQLA